MSRKQYQAPEGVDMVKATYRIPKPLFEWIDRMADERNMSANAMVVNMLEVAQHIIHDDPDLVEDEQQG